MKKAFVATCLLMAGLAAYAQKGTEAPYGKYTVTNAGAQAESMLAAFLLKGLQNGDFTITTETADPGAKPKEIDTSAVIDIVSQITFDEAGWGDICGVVNGVPSSVTITPKAITIHLDGTNDTAQYTIKQMKAGKNKWIFTTTDNQQITLTIDKYDIHTLKIPGKKDCRIRRE